MENSTQWWTQWGPFFPKPGHFFDFKIRAGETSPSLPVGCLWMWLHQYASISLNIPKYPWKCLNKLFWLSQNCEYAWSSYMFDRVLKMAQVLNVPGFRIWMAQLYKQGLHRVPNMVQYASIIPEYASIWLHVPRYVWTCLNKLFWLTRFLNMPHNLR